MKFRAGRKWIAAAAGLTVLGVLGPVGCEYLAPPHQAWTEARVTGQVVDGSTREPIRGASVSRVRSGVAGSSIPTKGGPRMEERALVAVTDREGWFQLAAVKNAYLLLETYSDFAVHIQVEARGYARTRLLFTNVTYAGGDKKTEPRIETGAIALWRETSNER
ncbi:MAG: hypothetical protein KF791_05885 [Verrucomicrobiae bacterium]|nr:hypothetical protein [Verrucomicrobiae bacterium]